MTFTFCPKCGAKIAWARSCSVCGAKIPLYDAANTAKGEAEPLAHHADASAKHGPWQRPKPFVRLILAVVGLGVITAIILSVLWVSHGPRTSDVHETPDSTPPKISAVTFAGIMKTSATVTWVTDEPASSQVECHDTSGSHVSPGDANLVTAHKVIVTPLKPGVTYHLTARSTDAAGNRTSSDELKFNTPLIQANGETESVNVYFSSARIVGSDGEPIVLVNNKEAIDVSWEYLEQFLLDDRTDEILYVDGQFVCSEYAETLHINAEKAGIRAAYVSLHFVDQSIGHAANAFQTTDRGLVYIDDTGRTTTDPCSADKSVDIQAEQAYMPVSLFPCPGRWDYWRCPGIVSEFAVIW